MRISVLIPTYNRKSWLVRTMESIAGQTFSDFEVIVVDASAPEDQLSEEEVARSRFKLNYIRYGVPGNVSKQRNIALERATGEIVLFIDDDVDFASNLFSDYDKLFSDARYVAIAGLVETPSNKRGSGPFIFKSPFNDVHAPNYQCSDFEIETYVICTANFAMRRSVYDDNGGFDEKLFGVLDDVDFGFKLKSKGVQPVHHPAVAVFHHMAKGSGSRSSAIPPWWTYYNIAYFQLKNFRQNKAVFFIKCSWHLLRPSSILLTLRTYFSRYYQFVSGYRRAIHALKHN